MTDGRAEDNDGQAPPPAPPPPPAAEEPPAADETPPELEVFTSGQPLPEPPPVRTAPPVQVAPPQGWPSAAAPLPLGRPEETVPPPPAPERIVHRRPAPGQRRPLLVRLPILAAKLVAVFVIGSVLWVAAYRFVAPPVTLTMIGDLVGGHRIAKQWMPLSRIDPNMARAAIAAEDGNFCTHKGFDFKAIEQAFARNQKGGRRIRGGSTISQQTAKNVFLWQGGGYFRKGLEAWFTFLIENLWGKRRIMEVYLNVAETGIGTYGVNAGAMRYFRHDASRLSPREAAQIAAVLPLPKKRAAIDPRGFTRRYANTITARIHVVRGSGYDACLR